MPTALEVAQVAGISFLGDVLNFTRKEVPIFNSFDVAAFTGLRFKTLSIETAGAEPTFRNFGEGYTPTGTPMTVREFAAARINFLTKVQESTMKVWNDENRGASGIEYFTLQQLENIKSAMLRFEKVMIYGTAYDPKGFPGMKQLTPALTAGTLTPYSTAPENDAYLRYFINAGGTTATTASSVYLVRFGPLDAQLKIGGPTGLGGFLKPTERRRVWIEATDPNDSTVKGDDFIIANGEGYGGLSVAGNNETGTIKPQQSIRRIGNLTNDSGKGVNEQILDYAMESFPPGKQPNVIYMSPRSQRQLRDSRPSQTVFLPTGGIAKNTVFANPLPDNFRGIPIIVSENILSTDAIEVPS